MAFLKQWCYLCGKGLNLLKACIGVERTRPSVLSVLCSTKGQINKDLIA